MKKVPDFFLKGLWVVSLAILFMYPEQAEAVVGQAEKFEDFKQEDLDQFHQNVTMEEQQRQMTSLQMQRQLNQTSGRQSNEIDRALSDIQSQLLEIPSRRRVRFEGNGKYQYDSNVIRATYPGEKDDSVMDTDGTVLFDFSGKKTDLRWELNSGRHWSVEFPEGDFWTGEERLRFRRKYMKKLESSVQSRIARNSSKTVEIDSNKVRWDSTQISALNYPMTKKLSLNSEMTSTMRTFTQEAFDQDSAWEYNFAPSGFWNFTPKSRVSLGYRFGSNRIRTKSGNADSHEVHAGCFGRMTRKSSGSIDLSFTHQTPRSRDTATVNGVTAGVGYILQLTGKTQITTQLIRSQQNSTSNLVSGSVDGENATVKNDNYFTNDSVSISLNSRLSTRLTSNFTINASHVHTSVLKDGNKDSQSTQFMFPFSWTATYFIRRWMALTFGYTFTYRTGYEKLDTFKDHLLQSSVRFAI